MAHDVLHDCPVCHKALHVTRLHCPSCGTTIEGDFQAERLLALTPEQRSFVYSFLRNRGNIREMEKELGISYPTVRARLDQVIAALGIEPAKAADNMRMVFFFIKAHPFLFLGWSQHTIAPGKRGYRHITV